MANSDPLVPYGIAVIVIIGCFVLVPYLRGKSELLTAWNVLLIGLILFPGAGSIEVHYLSELNWDEVRWFQPSAQEVQWYMWATSVFIVALLTAYYLNTPARRFAQRRLQFWPAVTVPVIFFVLSCCALVVLSSLVLRNVTGVNVALFKLGSKSTVFASVFGFALWNRNYRNVSWLLIFLGILAIAGFYAMVVSGGRRLLLGVAYGPILYFYWARARHWKPARTLFVLAIAMFGLLTVAAAYSKIRWYNLDTREERTAAGMLQQVKGLKKRSDLFSVLSAHGISYFGQNSGACALLTEYYVAHGALQPIPLNTLRFLVTYPIPRKLWHSKPQILGNYITREVAHIPATNWGCGIAGQGIYEGGIPALILYAILLTFFIRIFDEPLRLQPTNPFIISICAASIPHILAIPRGDMSTMVSESAECIVFGVIVGFIGRALFGTQRIDTFRVALPPGSRKSHSRAMY